MCLNQKQKNLFFKLRTLKSKKTKKIIKQTEYGEVLAHKERTSVCDFRRERDSEGTLKLLNKHRNFMLGNSANPVPNLYTDLQMALTMKKELEIKRDYGNC